MSVEHGGHGEETSITNILVSLIMALLLIPQAVDKLSETLGTAITGNVDHAH